MLVELKCQKARHTAPSENIRFPKDFYGKQIIGANRKLGCSNLFSCHKTLTRRTYPVEIDKQRNYMRKLNAFDRAHPFIKILFLHTQLETVPNVPRFCIVTISGSSDVYFLAF